MPKWWALIELCCTYLLARVERIELSFLPWQGSILPLLLEHETGLEPAKISHIGSVVSWPIPLTRAFTRHKVCISHYSVWNTERRLEQFTGLEPALRLLEPFHWFIFSELCLPIVLGLQCCVFQRDSTILGEWLSWLDSNQWMQLYQSWAVTRLGDRTMKSQDACDCSLILDSNQCL